MALTIASLNNEAAAAKAFTLVARDRVTGEWLNTGDTVATLDARLFVKQTPIFGKTKLGIPIRRSLVQYVVSSVEADGTYDEVCTVNFTLTVPQRRTALTDTQVKDAVAYVRNLITGSFAGQLWNGEV